MPRVGELRGTRVVLRFTLVVGKRPPLRVILFFIVLIKINKSIVIIGGGRFIFFYGIFKIQKEYFPKSRVVEGEFLVLLVYFYERPQTCGCHGIRDYYVAKIKKNTF